MRSRKGRPSGALVAERRWAFIQRCWSTVDITRMRPSNEEIAVDFTENELASPNRLIVTLGGSVTLEVDFSQVWHFPRAADPWCTCDGQGPPFMPRNSEQWIFISLRLFYYDGVYLMAWIDGM
jgi:hypothetical protein